jgi:curved DNA-binding protein
VLLFFARSPVPFDPYQVLGVPRTATTEELRSAYRALARRYHPDVNKDCAAEQRFKDLSQAYAILSDPQRRALFDEFGEASLSVQFDAEQARREREATPTPPPSSERRRTRTTNLDLVAQVEINASRARAGGEIRILSPVTRGSLTVTIPAGVQDGARIRLVGRGQAGLGGGRPGDLYVVIRIRSGP